MKIINAGSDHIPFIREIADETWYNTYGEILSEDQILYMLDMMYSEEALKQQMEESNHSFRIAKDESTGKFLGFVSFEHNYHGENKTKLHKLYVLPETQGTGLGKLLVEEVFNDAKENKSISVLLNMNRDNKAIGFYKRMGFEIAGQENIDIGNGYLMEDYIFEKKIE